MGVATIQISQKKIQTHSVIETKKPVKAKESIGNSKNSLFIKNSYAKRPNSCVRPPSSTSGIHSEFEKRNQEPSEISSVGDIKESEFSDTRKPTIEISEFLPGEAESIVLSAIIAKANKSRTPQIRKSLSSSNFFTSQQTSASKTYVGLKKFCGETLSPSLELQESLKQRGINL